MRFGYRNWAFPLLVKLLEARKLEYNLEDLVEESMGSLGIDSCCLDIRVTAGREPGRGETNDEATSY